MRSSRPVLGAFLVWGFLLPVLGVLVVLGLLLAKEIRSVSGPREVQSVSGQQAVETQSDTLPVAFPIRGAILFSPGTLKELSAASTAAVAQGIEFVRCGLGIYIQEKTYVDLLYSPKVIAATRVSTMYTPCPYATVLEWHTHPRNGEGAIEACFLSEMDLRNVMRPGRVATHHMVQVSPEIFCWWSYAQVLEHVRLVQFTQLLRPVRGQTSW